MDKVALPQLPLEVPRRGRMEFPLPYSPEVLRAFDPSGASFIGRTDEYRLVRITFDGDTTGVVSRALEKRPLQKQQQDSIAQVVAALGAELNVTVDASAMPRAFPLVGRGQSSRTIDSWALKRQQPESITSASLASIVC